VTIEALFCAASTSLKTHGERRAVRQAALERIVRCRTVAKVLSMGFVVRECFQCSAEK
jgi:hypothetical protein